MKPSDYVLIIIIAGWIISMAVFHPGRVQCKPGQAQWYSQVCYK